MYFLNKLKNYIDVMSNDDVNETWVIGSSLNRDLGPIKHVYFRGNKYSALRKATRYLLEDLENPLDEEVIFLINE
jgi:hypothetical protein